MRGQVSLLVNDVPISLDYFVQAFIDLTTSGMIASLKNTGDIKTLELTIDGDKVDINLNNNEVPINYFVAEMVKNTVTGMLSPLKGVNQINRVKLNITR